jgi:hypothetical protein
MALITAIAPLVPLAALLMVSVELSPNVLRLLLPLLLWA